jgi:hypothetical protein
LLSRLLVIMREKRQAGLKDVITVLGKRGDEEPGEMEGESSKTWVKTG